MIERYADRTPLRHAGLSGVSIIDIIVLLILIGIILWATGHLIMH